MKIEEDRTVYKTKYVMKIFRFLAIISLFSLSIYLYAQPANMDKVISQYEAKVKDGTAGVDHYYWLGYFQYYRDKDYHKAIDYFKKANEIDPKRADVIIGIGMSYMKLKEYNKALEYFKEAQKIAPNMAIAYHQAGESYYYQDEYELAAKEFEKAYKLTPNDASTCAFYGDTLYSLGDLNGAERYLKKAIDCGFEPGVHKIYYKLSEVYVEKNDLEKAIEYLNKCISENPKFAPAYNDLAVIYHRQKNYDQSIEYFKIAIKYWPQSAESHAGLALVYKELGKKELTLRYLNKAEQLFRKYDPKLGWPQKHIEEIQKLRQELLANNSSTSS